MNRNTIKALVHTILAETIDLSADELKTLSNSSDLVEDLGADDLAVVETIMALEEEFEIDIPDEDTDGLKTVGDLLNYLEKRFPEPVPFGPAPSAWQRIMGED